MRPITEEALDRLADRVDLAVDEELDRRSLLVTTLTEEERGHHALGVERALSQLPAYPGAQSESDAPGLRARLRELGFRDRGDYRP